jgi:hypothetical protein
MSPFSRKKVYGGEKARNPELRSGIGFPTKYDAKALTLSLANVRSKRCVLFSARRAPTT